MEEILNEGGIPLAGINVEHPQSYDDLLDPIVVRDASNYSNLVQVSQQTTKRERISMESIYYGLHPISSANK